MKLATALSERSDIQKRLAQLSVRLGNNARVQEGEVPTEDPDSLLKELEAYIDRMEYLVTQINITNAATTVDGETLTAMLSRRDALKLEVKILRDFLNEAGNIAGRASYSEIKIKSSVSVANLQKDLDAMSKELRLLDESIQEANWTIDLIEN